MGSFLNKNLKILLLAAVLAIATVWPAALTAAEYGLKVSSSLTVAENGQTSVKQVFSITGADKTNLPSRARLNIVGREPAGLSAQGTDGTKLTANYNADGNTVDITIPENRRRSKQAWSFSLSYKTNLLEEYGAVRAAQIPAMDTNLDVTAQTTIFSADLDLGFATVRGHQPSKTGIGVGQQILTFTHKGPQNDSIIIVFGEETFVTATFTSEITNRSWWWKDVGLTLPPDTNQQRVAIESIEPTPSKVRLDKDGNIRVFFNLAPLGSRQVSVTTRMSIGNPAYELSSAVSVSETDPSLIERYTRQTNSWQPLNLELELKEDATSADIAKAVFDGVVARAQEEMVNQEDFSLSLRTSSLKMSDWLVGELRHRGLPARVVLGLSMSDGRELSQQPKGHAWVEAHLAGVGWVTMDPYLGVYAGQYGTADPLRVGLALWGLEDDRPPVDLGLASIKFEPEAADIMGSAGQLGVNAQKYMILPFISIFNQSANLGPGTIVDGVTLTNQREELLLGSLAPYQSATQRSLLVGASAFRDETVTAQVGQDEDSKAEAESSTSYTILIVEAAILAMFLLWRRTRKRRRQTRVPATKLKRSKESLTLHDEAVGGSIEEENLVAAPDILPRPTGPSEPEPADKPPAPPKLVQ